MSMMNRIDAICVHIVQTRWSRDALIGIPFTLLFFLCMRARLLPASEPISMAHGNTILAAITLGIVLVYRRAVVVMQRKDQGLTATN
jgi:hypothetical protein